MEDTLILQLFALFFTVNFIATLLYSLGTESLKKAIVKIFDDGRG
jgi:hypothetical protein